MKAGSSIWLLLPLLVVLTGCGRSGPQKAVVPSVDTTGMEPQVAAKIEASQAAVRNQAESAAAWGRLGMVLHVHELYQEAASCYLQAQTLADTDYRWPYLSALALERLRPETAIEHFAEAAALNPDNPAFHISYGDALMNLGRIQDAEQQYRTALEQDADSSHALYGLARAAHSQGDLEAARDQLEQAASSAPNHGEVHALLAQVYFRLGEKEKAAREELLAAAYPDPSRAKDPIFEALQAEAVNSRAYTQRGLRLVKAGRFAEAETAFRQVLAIRPGNARDFANLGGALARQGKTAEAIANYNRALELEPEDPWTFNNLAMALVDRGDLETAAAHLERALDLDPTYAEAQLNLGLVRSRQRRADDAIRAYEQALELDPTLADAHTNLGTALAAQNRLEEATAHWRLALELDRRDLSALYNLTVALGQQGEHREAIQLLREGLDYAPNSSRLSSLLAWELATAPDEDLRDGEQAVRLARRVYEAYPGEASAADVLGAALAEVGEFDEAIQLAQQALQLAMKGSGSPAATSGLRTRLEGYKQGKPYRQPPRSPG